METWKEIEGFSGYYISNHGRVKTTRTRSEELGPRYLKNQVTKAGYHRITLRQNGAPKSFYIHSLVLTHFTGKRPKGLEARHLDGDKGHNFIGNLLWGTRQENTLDQVRHGVHCGFQRRSDKHPNTKLNESLVQEIRKRVDNGEECKAIGAEYNIPRTTISNIKHRRTYVYLPEVTAR